MTAKTETTPADEPSALPSFEDAVGSLSGFEELAIAKAFKAELSDLSATMTMRALVFVQARREQMNDQEAYRTAMQLTLAGTKARFAALDDDAEDDSGKG